MAVVMFSDITTIADFEIAMDILGGYREKMNKSDYAETALNLHKRVAFAENGEISWCRGKCYPRSLQAFLWAIREAYPQLDCWAIYDMWADCNEPVAYCANWIETDMLDKMHKRNHCRIYHEGCNPDDCYMGDEMPKEGEILRNFHEWSAGN